MNKGRTRTTKLSCLTYREVYEYLIKTWVSNLKSKKEKGIMIFGSCFIDERDNTDLLPCLFCSRQMWWCIFQYICIKFKFYYFHTERIPQISFLLKKKFSAFILFHSYMQQSYAFDPIKLSLKQCSFTQCKSKCKSKSMHWFKTFNFIIILQNRMTSM